MNPTQRIHRPGSIVRINAPEATGIHGKLGEVKSFNVAGSGIYKVLVEGLSHPSFLYKHEVILVGERPPVEAEPSPASGIIKARRNELRAERLKHQLKIVEIEKQLTVLSTALEIIGAFDGAAND